MEFLDLHEEIYNKSNNNFYTSPDLIADYLAKLKSFSDSGVWMAAHAESYSC